MVVHEDGTSTRNESLAADAGNLRRDLEGSSYLILNMVGEKACLRGGRGNTKGFLLFNQAGRLPLLTTILIAFTATLASCTLLILWTMIAAGIGIYLWQKKDTGKQVLDTIKLSIMLVRTLLDQYTLSHLTWTLATVRRCPYSPGIVISVTSVSLYQPIFEMGARLK
jgi:hypothetical protein